METILYNLDAYLTLQNVMTQSLERQRYMFYSNKVWPINVGMKYEKDENLYYMDKHLKPAFNNKIYTKSQNKSGMSYNKETKELKVWFGQQFYNLPSAFQDDFMNQLNAEWWISMPFYMRNLTNNTITKNIIKGKITNPRDLIKAFAKQSFGNKHGNISYELLYKIFSHQNAGSLRQCVVDAKYCTNVNQYFEQYQKHGSNGTNAFDNNSSTYWNTVCDMIHQAKILDKKVNLSWSTKRMNEVHREWTTEIMAYELDTVDDLKFDYPKGLELIPELKLISNKKHLYIEGKMMHHCIYTNYCHRIENNNYFAFTYVNDDVRATLGISMTSTDGAVINQFLGKYNAGIDAEHHEIVKQWFDKPETQKWFKEFNKQNESCLVSEL